jgi:hypothetical protein
MYLVMERVDLLVIVQAYEGIFDSLHFPVCVVNNIFNIKLYPSRTL